MPRNVRPSWIDLSVDGRTDISTGPRSRHGELSAILSVREDGSVLRLLDIDAIGSQDGKTVLIRVTDRRTHSTIFEERFNQ